NKLSPFAQQMIHYGADRVITIEDTQLEDYTPDGYKQAILSVINELSPYGIVMGHTAIGKDLTPALASKLQSGLVSDVIDIEVNEEQAIFTRPIYSGKAFEKKKILSGMIFATIRPNNIPM